MFPRRVAALVSLPLPQGEQLGGGGGDGVLELGGGAGDGGARQYEAVRTRVAQLHRVRELDARDALDPVVSAT